MRVGQTGPGAGLIDVEDPALRGSDDDNYEDEQQMSGLPTIRTLPCEGAHSVASAHRAGWAGTHSVGAQCSSLQDGEHQVSTQSHSVIFISQ